MPYAARIQPHPDFPLRIEVEDGGIRGLAFAPEGELADRGGDPDHPLISEASRQLAAYFAGELREFHLPLDLRGTAFQRRVWNALLAIPYGCTRSYSQLAAQLGDAGAARAVGSANHANPVAIIVPCHRVIAAGGALGGYGGGLGRKQFLLDLEAGLRGLAAAR